MKKLFYFLLLNLFCLSLINLSSCSEKDDVDNTDISYNDLPVAAKQFCEDYFSYTVVNKVIQINDDGEILYQVNFADGCEAVFDSSGIWQEVDAPDGKNIPDGIVPETIQQYLDRYYSDYGVNEINKTGYGYNVELNTGKGNETLDLMFGPDGTYLGPETD